MNDIVYNLIERARQACARNKPEQLKMYSDILESEESLVAHRKRLAFLREKFVAHTMECLRLAVKTGQMEDFRVPLQQFAAAMEGIRLMDVDELLLDMALHVLKEDISGELERQVKAHRARTHEVKLHVVPPSKDWS